jgi:hypothetical protein
MKNIHVLPTDKPSRLWFYKQFDNLLTGLTVEKSKYIHPQHIYITSDEEIKEGDYVLDDEQDIFQVLEINHTQGILRSDGFTYVMAICKKIILTTDQDLIADGIQVIDDVFLEWFVKNPSCEKVETYHVGYTDVYNIIIPKEEPKQELLQLGTKEFNELASAYFGGKPKQETLEEALIKFKKEHTVLNLYHFNLLQSVAEFGARWQREQILCLDKENLIKTDNDRLLYQNGVLKGMLRRIELQNQERMYSEEEVLQIFNDWYEFDSNQDSFNGKDDLTFEQWFEQFKKK